MKELGGSDAEGSAQAHPPSLSSILKARMTYVCRFLVFCNSKILELRFVVF